MLSTASAFSFIVILNLNSMKTAGIILIVIGLVLTIFGGVTFFTKKKVVDIGALEISKNERHHIPWSPIAGAVVILVGGGLLIMGAKKG